MTCADCKVNEDASVSLCPLHWRRWMLAFNWMRGYAEAVKP